MSFFKSGSRHNASSNRSFSFADFSNKRLNTSEEENENEEKVPFKSCVNFYRAKMEGLPIYINNENVTDTKNSETKNNEQSQEENQSSKYTELDAAYLSKLNPFKNTA